MTAMISQAVRLGMTKGAKIKSKCKESRCFGSKNSAPIIEIKGIKAPKRIKENAICSVV